MSHGLLTVIVVTILLIVSATDLAQRPRINVQTERVGSSLKLNIKCEARRKQLFHVFHPLVGLAAMFLWLEAIWLIVLRMTLFMY